MKSIKSLLLPKSVLFFVLFFSLSITACRESSDQGSTGSSSNTSTENSAQAGDEGTLVSFSFDMPSLIQQLNPTSETERFTPDQILYGSLYVLNTDDSTNATYDRTIYPYSV